MFFYRDAQYHRLGVNLHQVPVNCPFMAQSFSSLNFDGPLRNDANHAGNPQYAPNSWVDKFRPDTAEAPYAVSDNIVSRKSHYYHEGKPSEYDQARELYMRVMDQKARDHLHSNTAEFLKHVTEKRIKVQYLAQVYNIDPGYAKGIYDLLPKEAKGFDLSEVEAIAPQACTFGKNPKFTPSDASNRLVGFPPGHPIYNVI
jgi:catalase